MKPILFVLITLLLINCRAVAQTFSCDNFSIISFQPDSLNPNDYQLAMHFSATINDFVGYPYVSSIIDCNSDTVATGNMFYFAQLGSTTQAYPVTIINPSPWCDPLTATFIFGNGPLNEADTCYFSFETTALHEQTVNPHFSVFPNPTSDKITIDNLQADKLPFEVLNSYGAKVNQGVITPEQNELSLGNLSNGIYFIAIKDDASIKLIKVNKQ
jgi:hypothetical protein